MKKTQFLGMAAALCTFAFVIGGCPSSTDGDVPPPPSVITADDPGSVLFGFDAAAGAIKETEAITLSKAADGKKTIQAVQGYDTYLWILDDIEVRGNESAITLKASSMELGQHSLVLFVTKDGGAYSSELVTVTVTE